MINLIKKLLKHYYILIKNRKKLILSFSCSVTLNSIFEGRNRICSEAWFNGSIGYGSYLGSKTIIDGKIGRYTSIGPSCNVIFGTHPYTYPFVSTSPMFFSTRNQSGYTFADQQHFNEFRYADEINKYAIVIGNDCWIGANVSIISGVSIGDGVVVLTGSVVTKDVPDYAIVGGIPGKVIKYRFSDDDIEFLLKIKWWENGEEWMKKNKDLLINFNLLKEKYKHCDI
ncbi:CatB-related O-acetyltransferase [Saccharicrinis aurantiacus]|uniref:CatB-related O-acetyltransferase n=1 Tax=Saccharicrinis aurantiacus TaxID=1849719 RepID=UPI0009F9183C|nr:CatB-related O-acetyltransferase [Saccharicrinis aurantiacus]